MQSQLKRWFIYWIAAMLVVVVCFSIFLPVKEINLEEVDFTTTQSSELYFKNMRAYFYDQSMDEASKFVLYRISSRELSTAKNKLSFLLLSNWLQSECYIMTESGLINLGSDSLQLSYQNADQRGLLSLTESNNYANYIFAAQLYFQLEKNATLKIKHQQKWITLTEGEKKSLKKTLNDYFKLIGKLR